MDTAAAIKELKILYEAIRDEKRLHQNTAARIGNAFLAMLSFINSSEAPFIRKDREDSTNFLINFLGGISVDGDAIINKIRSRNFNSGVFGTGYAMGANADGKTFLEIDNLTVREKMLVSELLVSKIRAVDGQLVVSCANGKITDVELVGDTYHITLEENHFVKDDIIRCSRFDGKNVRAYNVVVKGSEGNIITIASSEFGGVQPSSGDELVQMGNTSVRARQNFIVISGSGNEPPHVSVMSDVKSKEYADCTKTRLGNLDGIIDSAFPADKQPQGYGIYSSNAYLKGHFFFSNGENVQQRIETGEGRLLSEIQSIRNDVDDHDSFLQNSNFSRGLEGWQSSVNANTMKLGDKLLFANGSILADLKDYSRIEQDEGHNVIRIRHSFVKQLNADLNFIPSFAKNDAGLKIPKTIYCSFLYKCNQQGHLSVRFENFNNKGFENFTMMEVPPFILQENKKYEQFTCSGEWNGTGDFCIRFTGDIKIYALILTTDKVGGLAYKYRTLFSQSDRLVRLCAGIYDKDGEALQESGLMVKADGAGIYAQDAGGNVAMVGTVIDENGKSVVKLTAENIKLEGIVTANNNFKILEDGSIEARNGKFTGHVEATSGKIAGFSIHGDHIGATSTANGDGGSLSIYPEYIRVGGTDAFCLIGKNVFPLSQNTSFTTAARITNHHEHLASTISYNYGVVIDVSGARKNYALKANAALLASSYICTAAEMVTLTGGEFSLDIAKNNIFLLNATVFSEMPLPGEQDLSDQFNIAELPYNFATVFTLHVRNNSEAIIVKNVHNENGIIGDLKLTSGDSVQLLATKADGFGYYVVSKLQ